MDMRRRGDRCVGMLYINFVEGGLLIGYDR